MTKQNCTSGTRTTKEKTTPFTRTPWERGSCVFYYKKLHPSLSHPTPFPLHRLPFQGFTLGSIHHG